MICTRVDGSAPCAGAISRFGLLAALLVIGLAAPQWARAQVQVHAMPAPVALILIARGDVGATETSLSLTFSGPPPQYTVRNDGTPSPSIDFSLSTRSQGAVTPSGDLGILRSIQFEQRDSDLIVHFSAAMRVRLIASMSANGVIHVTLRSLSTTSEADATPSAAHTLPQAVERPPEQDGFEIVPLRYADVSEVVGLLTDGLSVKSNDTFTPQEPAFGSAGMSNSSSNYAPSPTPTTVVPDAVTDAVGESVDNTIGVDRRLNAIILKGSPELIARLKAKIAVIDVPVQSVLLETVFVELDESGVKNVGLDFNNANNQIATATIQSGQYNSAGGSIERPLTSFALQGAIYAQIAAGHGRIVSEPRISAQSGSTAKIITGDALPILTAITLSGVNGVSQQVQYVNVGVTLQIAPRVTDDGFVTSHIFCVVSSVTGTSQGYPTISQREATTSATVRDGETFVIGGLTEESELTSDNKVPGVGDLPIAGQLFHYHSGTRAKTELFIVVTPHVVKRGDQPATLSGPLAIDPALQKLGRQIDGQSAGLRPEETAGSRQ